MSTEVCELNVQESRQLETEREQRGFHISVSYQLTFQMLMNIEALSSRFFYFYFRFFRICFFLLVSKYYSALCCFLYFRMQKYKSKQRII